MIFSEEILHFLFNLQLPFKLPNAVEVLNVHGNAEVKKACTAFYNKFYCDNNQRHLLLGINPGRFGGGVTGIPFTDSIRLQNACGIENDFQKKQELSSAFIYEMIDAFGGPEKFYTRFYISAVSPLGFVKDPTPPPALSRPFPVRESPSPKSVVPPGLWCVYPPIVQGRVSPVCFGHDETDISMLDGSDVDLRNGPLWR